ncbi:MAG: hypothetical protein ACOY90_00515 [Candidatus Zhuqueibacterota bacterium]
MNDRDGKTETQRREFNAYCLEEIESNLKSIEQLIPEQNVQELDGAMVGAILECAENMEDLAMVYGYPGIESLAFNLASAMANFTHEQNSMPEDIGLRVHIALKAIRQMVRIDNDVEEEKLIREITQTMHPSQAVEIMPDKTPIQSADEPKPPASEKTPPLPAEFAELEFLADDTSDDDIIPATIPPQEIKQPPQFEIKELDSLMKLVEEIENHKKLVSQAPEPMQNQEPVLSETPEPAVAESPEEAMETAPVAVQTDSPANHLIDVDLSQLAQKKSQRESQAKEIEQVFNDIFREETIENLDFLKQSLQKVKDEQSPGEAIMRIKESCSGLRDAANCFHVKDVQPSLTLLDKLAKERLSYNQTPDESVFNALTSAEQHIRNYMEQGKPQDFNFQPLNDLLNNILESHQHTVITAGFDQLLDKNFDIENTIKVVEEEKLLGNVPPPAPETKKKVKVVFSPEDERGRWMSKFK